MLALRRRLRQEVVEEARPTQVISVPAPNRGTQLEDFRRDDQDQEQGTRMANGGEKPAQWMENLQDVDFMMSTPKSTQTERTARLGRQLPTQL